MYRTFLRLAGAAGCALLVCTAAAANDLSPYGLCVHLPTDAQLDKVKHAGVDWIRVDFNWVNMEPQTKGVFRWQETDRVVQSATDRGLKVFATLAYSPRWANGNQHHSAPPQRAQDWVDYVAAVVARYKDRVAHWGMWNEPNLGHFFSGTKDDYVNTILIPGAQAAKAVDPGCFVLGPDLSHHDGWEDWMKHVLRNAGQHLDVVTHHIYKSPAKKTWRLLDRWTYPWEGRPYFRATLRHVLRDNGAAGKPVWLTETGQRSAGGEREQAEFYRDFLERMQRRDWLKKVFFYELTDHPHDQETWGLLRRDQSEKPAYGTYRDFILAHPAPVPPPSTPWSGLVFEAERDLAHGLGRAEADGWSASTATDARGHLSYGPYTNLVPAGARQATFRLLLDDVTANDDVVLTLDVFDATRGQVLTRRELRRREFQAALAYQDFTLSFTATSGHLLEFRTYWHDTSYARQDRVSVR